MAGADSADQTLAGFETYTTRNGIRRTRVIADTAYFFEATQSVTLKQMTVVFFDERGAESSTLTSKEGTLFLQSSLVLAKGGVVLRAKDGRTLRSEALRIDETAQEVSTDQAFTLDTGTEHISGTSLKADPEFKNVTASKAKGRAGKPMALPGQQ